MGRYDLYNKTYWKKNSKAFALSKNCICERCGRSVYVSGITTYLPKEKRLRYVVHHKEYLNDANINNDEIALGWDNLELLCINCHDIEHNEQPTRNGLMFDENGNLIERKIIKRN